MGFSTDSLHAEEEMDDDGLSILDIKVAFLQVKLLSAKKTELLKNGNMLSKVRLLLVIVWQ